MQPPPRVVLVGVHGFGRVHLARLGELAAEQRLRIAGLADPRPPDADVLAALPDADTIPVAADAAALLADVRPDVTIVSTPIHTHLPLAAHALAAESHLLLEKPPTADLAQFDALSAQVAAAGRACQVGFQALGSRAVEHAALLVADGRLGRLRGIGVHGAWVRDDAYFARAPWAGRMRLGDAPVTDGALTNAFAHATSAALRVVGAAGDAELTVELERYRTMSPEGDDTAAARITVGRIPVVVAVTLCAAQARDPMIIVHGERGRLELSYTRDTLSGHVDGQIVDGPAGRTGLLENLLAHIADPDVALLSPLPASRPFMQVLEAVRLDRPAQPVPASASARADGGTRTVAVGSDEATEQCAEHLLLFSELPRPWP